MRLIDADALIEEYDRVHVGEPGGARKLMMDAPTITEIVIKEPTNPDFKSCSNCIYCDADEAVCIQLQCIHAVSVLKECYAPQQAFKEADADDKFHQEHEDTSGTSEWIPLDTYMGQERYICSKCGEITKDTAMGKPRARFCPGCGRRMV